MVNRAMGVVKQAKPIFFSVIQVLELAKPEGSSEIGSGNINSRNPGLSSRSKNSSYSILSPPFFFTSTTLKLGVNSNISTTIVNGPFTPSRDPSKLTRKSFFRTLNLTTFAISSSFDIIVETDAPVTNRDSSPPSSNKPDKLNPLENEIKSNAFKLAGLGMLTTRFRVSNSLE
ncbi:hypothetical protein Hanom_Chr16g01482711 [Helianthus anomalus]